MKCSRIEASDKLDVQRKTGEILVTMTPVRTYDLLDHYNSALNAGFSEFRWDGNVILTDYAYYMLDYLLSKHRINIPLRRQKVSVP